MEKKLLLIFIKNPELGKVKTRLARKIGDKKALKVYNYLLSHTLNISRNLGCNKVVCYDERISYDDIWSLGFEKHLQNGDNLGDRMLNAFVDGFARGSSSIVIIGSDCAELNTSILEAAFSALESGEIVIGPARDGGYYLLGMNKLHPSLFENKSWSSHTVLAETVADIERLGLEVSYLPVLSDVDEEEDLVTLPKDILL